MADVDLIGSPELRQITVDAVVRAAERGLLTPVEAGLLIDRILSSAKRPEKLF